MRKYWKIQHSTNLFIRILGTHNIWNLVLDFHSVLDNLFVHSMFVFHMILSSNRIFKYEGTCFAEEWGLASMKLFEMFSYRCRIFEHLLWAIWTLNRMHRFNVFQNFIFGTENSLALQYSQINLLWLFAKLETAFRIESNTFLSIVSSRAGFFAVNLKLDRFWVWSVKLVVCLCLQDLCFFNSSLLLKQLPHW